MDVRIADHHDIAHLARLLWLHSAPAEQANQSTEDFAVDLATWWASRGDSHVAFVARSDGTQVVGMAWLALVPRVPRPGNADRQSADLQGVFVASDERGKGIGSALVHAACAHALHLGASRVTVHSSAEAVPLYERLGFASGREFLRTPTE